MRNQQCDIAHASSNIAGLLLPLMILAGCAGGQTGDAPGLAGSQLPDPITLDFPLAYIKRPPPAKDIDVRDLITSTPGGDLYIRDKASASGVETNITKDITTGKGDVRDPDVSPDGTKSSSRCACRF